MVEIASVTQEPNYVCIRFEEENGVSSLLRLGPVVSGPYYGQQPERWYAEALSVRRDYLINQQFYSRDEAAAYAMRLYEKVVLGGDTSFR